MYIVILNPTSGNGLTLRYLGDVEAVLRQRKIEHRIERAGDNQSVSDIARRISRQDLEGIIILGGDGTIFDAINGLAGSTIPLLFVSCGTGNDFVRSLRLPKDPIAALELQLELPVRRIDLGRMNEFYFANVAGTGFDVEVLRYTEQYKEQYTGLRAYLMGLRAALKAYKPMKAKVSFDGGPEKQLTFSILSVGNGRYIGGGMRAVPDAVVDDGLLDVVVVKPVPRILIPLLIVFFIAGKHVILRFGKMRRCSILSIRREDMTINLDGELRNSNIARFSILPSALYVRIP